MADESMKEESMNGAPKMAAVDAWPGIASSVADVIGNTPLVQLNRVGAGAGARVGLFCHIFCV
jgi:hypothetical protein